MTKRKGSASGSRKTSGRKNATGSGSYSARRNGSGSDIAFATAIGYAIPILLMIVFGLALASTQYMKSPRGEADDFAAHIQAVRQSVLEGDWETAQNQLQKARAAWRTVEKRIQLSSQSDELRAVHSSLASLEGAIEARDAQSSLRALAETREQWDQIGR